jgi:hypothetical protein
MGKKILLQEIMTKEEDGKAIEPHNSSSEQEVTTRNKRLMLPFHSFLSTKLKAQCNECMEFACSKERHNGSVIFVFAPNEQVAEIERLEEDIQSLREEEMKCKEENSDDRDGSHRADLILQR